MSATKQVFAGSRTPVPKFITDLFTNDECTVDDEEAFLTNIKHNIAEFLLVGTYPKEYESWKFLIFKLYQLLEKHIQNLRELKALGYNDTAKAAASENIIENILGILDEYLRSAKYIELFNFPYFDDLIELTTSVNMLKAIVSLSLTLVYNKDYYKKGLVHLISTFRFLVPFAKALFYFNWDYNQLVQTISKIFAEKNSNNRVPQLLRNLITSVLDYGNTILIAIESDNLLEIDNKSKLVSILNDRVRNHHGITKENNPKGYFKSFGEVLFASFLFAEQLNERILPEIGIIHCYEGMFFEALKEDDVLPELSNFSLEPYQLRFKYVLEHSIIDVALEKAREISTMQNASPEELSDKLKVLSLYIAAISFDVELYKTDVTGQTSSSDLKNLLRRLFCVNVDDNRPDKEPALIEIWKITTSQYKLHYSKVTDEDRNMFAKASNSLKDNANIVMSNLIGLINSIITQITSFPIEQSPVEVIINFEEEFYFPMNFLLEDMLQRFENYSLVSNYQSILSLISIFYVFREITSMQASAYLNVPLRIIKKVESFLELSFTEEFENLFDNPKDAELIYRVISLLFELLGNLFMCFETNELVSAAAKEYLAHMAKFTQIELILEHAKNAKKHTNKSAQLAQDQIIRYYVALHLRSQLLAFTLNEAEQILFYNVERLKQAWQIIQFYSFGGRCLGGELSMTIEILESLSGEVNDLMCEKVINSDVLTLFMTKSYLNLEEEDDAGDFENLAEAIDSLSYKEGWSTFASNLANHLQEIFESLLQQGHDLQNPKVSNDKTTIKPLFIIEYKMFKFGKRLLPLLNLMSRYEQTAISTDPNLQKVITEYLPKVITSPIFYLLGSDNITELIENFPTLSILQPIMNTLLQLYPDKILEGSIFIKNELEKKKDVDSDDMFMKKFKAFRSSTGDFDGLFSEDFFDDIQEAHRINSNITFLNFMKDLQIGQIDSDNETFQNQISEFFTKLSQLDPELTKLTIEIRYLLLLRAIKKNKKKNILDLYVINESGLSDNLDRLACFDYFNKKLVTTTTILQNAVGSNDEDILLYRLCVLATKVATIVSLPESFLQINTYFNIIGPNLLFCIEVIKTLYDLSSKVGEFASEDYISDVKISPSNLKYETISQNPSQFIGIAKDLLHSYFVSIYKAIKHSKGQKKHKNSLRTAWDLLSESLDVISPKLLYLCVLDKKRRSTHNLSNLIGSMFKLYSAVYSSLYSNEKEDDLQQEKHPKPKQSNKKGKKTFRDLYKAKKNANNQENKVKIKEEPAHSIIQIEDIINPVDEKVDLQKDKETYERILFKFIIFYDPELFPLDNRQQEVYRSFIKKAEFILCGVIVHQPEESKENIFVTEKEKNALNVEVYRNYVINRIRNLSPVFVFAVKAGSQAKNDHNFYLKTIVLLTNEIGVLIEKLSITDMLEEVIEFIETDFTVLFVETIKSLQIIAKQMITHYLNTNTMHEAFNDTFKTLNISLRRWSDICLKFSKTQKRSAQLFEDGSLVSIYYFSLQYLGQKDTFASDKKIVDFLIQGLGEDFYVLAELFVLDAFEPEKIVKIKLKALAYLDKSGSRIFQSSSMKALEMYFGSSLLKVWKEEFSIKQLENSENNKHTNKIVITKEGPGMKGRTVISNNGKKLTVSTLTFLKHNIAESTKIILETMMNNIFSTTQAYIAYLADDLPQIAKNEKKLQDKIQIQISRLAVLVNNYPEIAPIITSFKLDVHSQSQSINEDCIPRLKDTETFIGFFIKHVCYLFSFSLLFFSTILIERNDNPIFIEYENRPILLSSYNELVLFQEIFNVLEDTLKVPEKLLKTMYTKSIWSILSQASIHLLSLPAEPKEEHFKILIINNLYTICFKALKIYVKSESQIREESQIIYIFLARLASREMAIKTRNELLRHDKFLEGIVSSKSKLHWTCSILKEQSYLDAYNFPKQDFNGLTKPILNEDFNEDGTVLQASKHKSWNIDFDIIASKSFH